MLEEDFGLCFHTKIDYKDDFIFALLQSKYQNQLESFQANCY